MDPKLVQGGAGEQQDGEKNFRKILGIRFFFGSAAEAVTRALRGGLAVFPAAPLLVAAADDAATQAALAQSDLALPDSGLMVLIWNVMTGERLRRISGLEYIKLLLQRPEWNKGRSALWIMPTPAAMEVNLRWLQESGQEVSRADCYLAPIYPAGMIEDPVLLDLVRTRRPAHLVMAIGGGVQERLGRYLRDHLDYRPAIHCTGAAIGFLSGEQANIPAWADRYYLGWFFRCVQSPAKFVPRYWAARKLLVRMLRHGSGAPSIASQI